MNFDFLVRPAVPGADLDLSRSISANVSPKQTHTVENRTPLAVVAAAPPQAPSS